MTYYWLRLFEFSAPLILILSLWKETSKWATFALTWWKLKGGGKLLLLRRKLGNILRFARRLFEKKGEELVVLIDDVLDRVARTHRARYSLRYQHSCASWVICKFVEKMCALIKETWATAYGEDKQVAGPNQKASRAKKRNEMTHQTRYHAAPRRVKPSTSPHRHEYSSNYTRAPLCMFKLTRFSSVLMETTSPLPPRMYN